MNDWKLIIIEKEGKNMSKKKVMNNALKGVAAAGIVLGGSGLVDASEVVYAKKGNGSTEQTTGVDVTVSETYRLGYYKGSYNGGTVEVK